MSRWRWPGPSADAPHVVVAVSDEVGVGEEDRWAGLARSVLEAEGVEGPAELALSFVDEADMAELNRRWMDEDGPTDVLSWAIDPPGDDGPGPVLLGDVVVCPAEAAMNSADLGSEVRLLVVHGVLHLLGYDHELEDDRLVMEWRQAAILEQGA